MSAEQFDELRLLHATSAFGSSIDAHILEDLLNLLHGPSTKRELLRLANTTNTGLKRDLSRMNHGCDCATQRHAHDHGHGQLFINGNATIGILVWACNLLVGCPPLVSLD